MHMGSVFVAASHINYQVIFPLIVLREVVGSSPTEVIGICIYKILTRKGDMPVCLLVV